jgi:hypothetical protein
LFHFGWQFQRNASLSYRDAMTSTEGGQDVLADLAALGPFFAVETHPPGTRPMVPWRPLNELTAAAGPLRTRIEAVRAALAERSDRPAAEIEPRVAASVTHLGLVARLIAPSVAAAAIGRELAMCPGELWWQDTLGGPMPLSVPFPGAAAMVNLLDEVIAPLTAAVSNLVTVSPRVLWGNVASAASQAAAQVAARYPEVSRPAWTAAAALFATPWLSRERQPPGPGFRRSSCCLIYRVAVHEAAADRPRNVCSDCVLRQV